MFKRLKLFLFLILASMVLAGGWLIMQVNTYLDAPLPLHEPVGYELRSGSNFIGVLNELSQQGIVTKPRYLRWYGRISGLDRRIKAGEYQLQAGMTPRQLIALLTSGKVRQYSLTIVEGWTFRQMMDLVRHSRELKQTLNGLDGAAIMERLGQPGVHPEGWFLPDTYHFPKGMKDLAFLRRANQAMQAVLDSEWARRAENLPYKTPYEALIMASIVEKETGLASERRAIAGVFVRRLKKGMRLQTDPTVIYGMGERYQGNIRKSDLLRDTAYNTYRRGGLPPTPIALPGRDAIHASLHPDDSDNIYFVARGDGSHQFSATLKQHNEAVIKYQLKGRRKPFSSYTPKQ